VDGDCGLNPFPLPAPRFSFGYLPKGPVTRGMLNLLSGQVWKRLACIAALFLKVEQDGWQENPPRFSIPIRGFKKAPNTSPQVHCWWI